MSSDDHNRLIKQAARAELKPIGCVQKGQSRLWYDDRKWWVVVVEFQPSSWAKGSYLNVGACWLWHDKNYFSFDDGNQAEAFREYSDAWKFEQDAQFLAVRAKEAVFNFRLKYPSIYACAEHLKAQACTSEWEMFNSAVAAGLAGDVKFAKKRLSELLGRELRFDWQKNLHSRAAALYEIVQDTERFKTEIANIVKSGRALLKLLVLEPDNIFLD